MNDSFLALISTAIILLWYRGWAWDRRTRIEIAELRRRVRLLENDADDNK